MHEKLYSPWLLFTAHEECRKPATPIPDSNKRPKYYREPHQKNFDPMGSKWIATVVFQGACGLKLQLLVIW